MDNMNERKFRFLTLSLAKMQTPTNSYLKVS